MLFPVEESNSTFLKTLRFEQLSNLLGRSSEINPSIRLERGDLMMLRLYLLEYSQIREAQMMPEHDPLGRQIQLVKNCNGKRRHQHVGNAAAIDRRPKALGEQSQVVEGPLHCSFADLPARHGSTGRC